VGSTASASWASRVRRGLAIGRISIVVFIGRSGPLLLCRQLVNFRASWRTRRLT
jgi:hypothetical protein